MALPHAVGLAQLTGVPEQEIRIRTLGDSMTAFTFGQNGEILAEVDTMPWFTRTAGMSDPGEKLVFYNMPGGYANNVFGQPPDAVPVVGQGNFRDGFSVKGYGQEIYEAIAPDGTTVLCESWAKGGTTAEQWANNIPDWENGFAADAGEFWGTALNGGIAYTLAQDAADGIRPIVHFSLGGNDMRDLILYDGGKRMDDDAWWHESSPEHPNPDGFMGTLKQNLTDIIDYLHWLTGGNPRPYTVMGRPANTPGNVEIVQHSYPNWYIRNGDVVEWWPAGAIDRPGNRTALWVMDGVGAYRDFYRDFDPFRDNAEIEYGPTGNGGIHSEYTCQPVGVGEHNGPIPLADQMERSRTDPARELLADQWYRRFHPLSFFLPPINGGDAVNRGHATWTVDAMLNTFSGLGGGHPTWTLDPGNGQQGDAPGDLGPGSDASDDYAPAVMNGWNISSRSVTDESVGRFFRDKLETVYEEISIEQKTQYGPETTPYLYVPIWTLRAAGDPVIDPGNIGVKDDVPERYRPWPEAEFCDLLHLGPDGAQYMIEGIIEQLLEVSTVLRFPPQPGSSCSAPLVIAAGEIPVFAADPERPGLLGCCDSGYRVSLRTRGGGQQHMEMSSLITQLDWSRYLDDTGDAGVTIRKTDKTREIALAIRDAEPFAHELHIERDGLTVWEGNLSFIEESPTDVKLGALDLSSWLDVRLVRDLIDYENSSVDAAVLLREVITSAMSIEDSVGLLPNMMIVEGAGRTFRKIEPTDDTFAVEVLRDMSTELIDWTMHGRRLIIVPDNYELGRLLPLRASHFRGDGWANARRALDFGTRRVKRGSGFSSSKGGISERYGLVERVDRDDGVLTQAAADEANELWLLRRPRVPTELDMENGAQLACDAPVRINDLVPGVTIPLDLEGSLMGDHSIARLTRVKVEYSTAPTVEEKVSIGLVAAEIPNAVDDPDLSTYSGPGLQTVDDGVIFDDFGAPEL